MKIYQYIAVIAFGAVFSIPVQANPVDELQSAYQKQGATGFSADRGAALWKRSFTNNKSGKPRSCTSCHSADLTKKGRHQRTGKIIKPMAPSVNNQRLTKVKKINKWFKRNCKWTMGRECSVQEKGDLLTFLKGK